MILVCMEAIRYMWDNQNVELAREKQLIIPNIGISHDRQLDDTTESDSSSLRRIGWLAPDFKENQTSFSV